MLDHVGQRLLDDAVDGGLELRLEALAAEIGLGLDLEALDCAATRASRPSIAATRPSSSSAAGRSSAISRRRPPISESSSPTASPHGARQPVGVAAARRPSSASCAGRRAPAASRRAARAPSAGARARRAARLSRSRSRSTVLRRRDRRRGARREREQQRLLVGAEARDVGQAVERGQHAERACRGTRAARAAPSRRRRRRGARVERQPRLDVTDPLGRAPASGPRRRSCPANGMRAPSAAGRPAPAHAATHELVALGEQQHHARAPRPAPGRA